MNYLDFKIEKKITLHVKSAMIYQVCKSIALGEVTMEDMENVFQISDDVKREIQLIIKTIY